MDSDTSPQAVELERRRIRARWVLVLGSQHDAARELLEHFFSSGHRFPEAILGAPAAASWMQGDLSPDSLAARAYENNQVHLVPVDPRRAALDDVHAARDDRLLVVLPRASGRQERIQAENMCLQLLNHVQDEAPILLLIGVTQGDLIALEPLIELTQEIDPGMPIIAGASAIDNATKSFPSARELIGFVGAGPTKRPQLSIGDDSRVTVDLDQVWTDPSMVLDHTWRLVTVQALDCPPLVGDLLPRAYEALWSLDEGQFAPTTTEDLLEWWALQRLAFQRAPLHEWETRLQAALRQLGNVQTDARRELVLNVHPGAGTTIFLHQLALHAARAGYPTLVLRAMARGFAPQALKDFLLKLEDVAIEAAQRDGVDGFRMPPSLVVLDTGHDTAAIRDAIDELWKRFRSPLVVLSARYTTDARSVQLAGSLDETEPPTGTAEIARVAPWLTHLGEVGIKLPNLHGVPDLDEWVRELQKEAGGPQGYGFFHVLNQALMYPLEKDEVLRAGVVSRTIRRRMEEFCRDLIGDSRISAMRELTLVLELAKAGTLGFSAFAAPVPVPISALQAAVQRALKCLPEDAMVSKATPKLTQADIRDFFRSGRLPAKFGTSGAQDIYSELTDTAAKRWFLRTDRVVRQDQEHRTMDAVMVAFQVDTLRAFVDVAKNATEPLRSYLLSAAGVAEEHLDELARADNPMLLVSRILKVLSGADLAGELEFCESLSESFLRGTDKMATWRNGKEESRVELYASLNRELVNGSRVLLHHEAIVLRRSTWNEGLTTEQAEERLTRAVANVDQALELPWREGQRDDAPTHLLTTQALCLRSLFQRTRDPAFRKRAEEALRRALAEKRGTTSPHTQLALAEILVETLASRPAPSADPELRRAWLEADVRTAIEAAPLLHTIQRDHHRWRRARTDLLAIVDSLAAEAADFPALHSMKAWLDAERHFLELLTREEVTPAARDALVETLWQVYETAPEEIGLLIAGRLEEVLTELQEDASWLKEREVRLDELYMKLSMGRPERLRSPMLFRWAVAKFQLEQFGPGSAMFSLLRQRSDAKRLDAVHVPVRDASGNPRRFSARIHRADGDHLHLNVESSGTLLFRARGRADQLDANRRNQLVQGVVVRLRPLGPACVPERFYRGRRRER